jgi:hypothetical protein
VTSGRSWAIANRVGTTVAASPGSRGQMTRRIRQETVTFQNDFSLDGIRQIQPPGSYAVEIEEELITELSFPAYRRSATVIRLPSSQIGGYEAATIDPVELEAALQRDAALGSLPLAESDHATEAEPTASSGPQNTSFFIFLKRFRKAAARLR